MKYALPLAMYAAATLNACEQLKLDQISKRSDQRSSFAVGGFEIPLDHPYQWSSLSIDDLDGDKKGDVLLTIKGATCRMEYPLTLGETQQFKLVYNCTMDPQMQEKIAQLGNSKQDFPKQDLGTIIQDEVRKFKSLR